MPIVGAGEIYSDSSTDGSQSAKLVQADTNIMYFGLN